jgi:hypothetical protein
MRNPQTDLAPILTRQSHEGFTLLRLSAFFSLKKNLRTYLRTQKQLLPYDHQVRYRVPPVYTLCTTLEWPADNAEITSHH